MFIANIQTVDRENSSFGYNLLVETLFEAELLLCRVLSKRLCLSKCKLYYVDDLLYDIGNDEDYLGSVNITYIPEKVGLQYDTSQKRAG